MKKMFRVCAVLVLTAAMSAMGADKKKIVMVAGTPSHGPGDHEFNAGTLLLQKCLTTFPEVEAVVYTNGWPKDPNAFKGAAAIMLFMDGGGGHPVIKDNHLQVIGDLMKQGVGLGCYHYGVEVPKDKGGPEFLEWIGGYYEDRFSTNPHWTADIKSLPPHPITRGVKPFAVRDEWYYNMHFRPEMKGVTPILVAKPDDETRKGTTSSPRGPYSHIVAANGREEVLAWAVERPDGGRGFGFTGGHAHKNFSDENFRKLVLNSLVWLAKVEVPKEGVASSVTAEELEKNLDPKGNKKAAAPAKTSSANAKYKSGLVKSGTVNVDVDVTGAKELWLVVSDGGDGINSDWADWINPELVGSNGSTKLTELKWKSASAGHGTVSVNKNVEGKPIRVGGKSFDNGIGVHAPSVLQFDIAGKGFTRFKATGGLDNGGTDQGGGSTVEFLVFTEKPSDAVMKVATENSANKTRGYGLEAAREDLKSFTVADGLEVSVFASEPKVKNPTNMDIDARGRMWITEGANYRVFQKWGMLEPKGDRIVILEDTDGDGVADLEKTFYQGKDINAALGICVLGNQVIVSCSPNILVFTDTDGDDKADKKEVLFSGISGVDHDHGAHAFVFGPDGKLYFNIGNEGKQLKTADGKEFVVDMAGNKVNTTGKPYRQGLVFRCNADGTQLETLGWNFRNNYEVNVDSFGTLWQSDNDDDGNKGVRINYVMEFGNYGFTDEMTGASWGTKRSNMEEEIPRRHWHLNDPGVVPTLLLTGGGSPTGIAVYEGNLLPEPFRNQMIHADAGPNVVRSYPVKNDGAGYSAEMVNLLKSRDSWFRPSDVCVGPDGSVYVADWNDPGVGGHNMGDNNLGTLRGRVYRIAPQGHKIANPKYDFSTTAGCVEALQSPNMSARYTAWTKLNEMGSKAEKELLKVWKGKDARQRARALHLLARIKGKEDKYIAQAIKDKESDLRITGLRIARELKKDVIPLVKKLAKDPSAQVRRECAIALRQNSSSDAPALWATLARQHDGKDRWYLEALGLAMDKQEEKYFDAWLAQVGDKWNTPAGRDIIWRSRSSKVPALLVKILTDKNTTEKEKARYMRAFDFLKGPEKDQALLDLLTASN